MKMYTGNKPCPGCGKPGNETPRYSADSCCRECMDMIALGRKTKAANENFKDYVTLKMFPFYVSDTRESEAIFNRLTQVCKTINDPSKRGEDTLYIGEHSSNKSITITCTQYQADELKNLYFQIQESFKAILKRGKEDGTSLLIGLNNGTLSLSDFEKQTP